MSPSFLELRQHVSLESQWGHTEEEIHDTISWDDEETGKEFSERERHQMKAWRDEGVTDDGMCDWIPPDLADTAQYSALISSENLMASCSIWDNCSGDWGERDREEAM